MVVLLVLILTGVFHGYVSGYPAAGYALHFTLQEVTDYANVWGMRSLTQFTVCFWMKSSASNPGTPFSYAVPGHDNELLIEKYNDFKLCIGQTCQPVHESANDGIWHHICVTWRNSDGVWQFYKDGALHPNTDSLRAGYTIPGGGSLVLGQEQDSVGGGFVSSSSFQGSLTNVNVWSYVLPESKITSMSTSCREEAGDVYKWSDFIYGVKGKAAVFIPSPCSLPNSRR